MTAVRSFRSLVLGVYPTSRGMGWVVFDGPFGLLDWRTVEAKKDKNAKCLKMLKALLTKFEPETVVLEAFGRGTATRSLRIINLCKAAVAIAADHGAEVAVYTKREVQACFDAAGAKTRHEIAEAVARNVPTLRARLPRKRRAYDTEPSCMALFNAAAVVLTHYRFGANKFFEELKGGAT